MGLVTTDKSMWQWLSKARSPTIDLTRTENLASEGEPDVQGYATDHGSFWLELKQVPNQPKRSTSSLGIKVRPSQVIWFEKRIRMKCKTAYFLVNVGRERFLVPGRFAWNLGTWTYEDIKPFNVSHLSPSEIISKVLA